MGKSNGVDSGECDAWQHAKLPFQQAAHTCRAFRIVATLLDATENDSGPTALVNGYVPRMTGERVPIAIRMARQML